MFCELALLGWALAKVLKHSYCNVQMVYPMSKNSHRIYKNLTSHPCGGWGLRTLLASYAPEGRARQRDTLQRTV